MMRACYVCHETDERDHERARALFDELIEQAMQDCEGNILNDGELVAMLADAFAQMRREALEEAAKMAEAKADRAMNKNVPEYNFGYRGGLRGLADEIRERARG